MNKWISPLAALIFAAILAQSAQASIYVADKFGNLGIVNPVTKSVDAIGPMGGTLTDITMDASGQMWGVDYYNLYMVNKTTAALTLVGPLGLALPGSNALAIDSNGVMYLASTYSTQLFTVDKVHGTAAAIGDTGWYSAGDLAFFNGQLYWTAISQFGGVSGDNYLIRISLSSGVAVDPRGVISVANDGTKPKKLYGLAVDGGVLYAVSGAAAQNIYSFNDPTTTALVTDCGSYAGLGPANGASELVVPEPAALLIWSLLGVIAVGCGLWRKRKVAWQY